MSLANSLSGIHKFKICSVIRAYLEYTFPFYSAGCLEESYRLTLLKKNKNETLNFISQNRTMTDHLEVVEWNGLPVIMLD